MCRAGHLFPGLHSNGQPSIATNDWKSISGDVHIVAQRVHLVEILYRLTALVRKNKIYQYWQFKRYISIGDSKRGEVTTSEDCSLLKGCI